MSLYKEAKERREKLLKQMSQQESLLLFSAQEKQRSRDVFFPFRQDSYFYYLIPFLESNFGALLLTPHHKQQSILFIDPGDDKSALWDGKRCSLSELKERFQLDAVYTWKDWIVQGKAALKGIQKIYCSSSQLLENKKGEELLKNLSSSKTELVGVGNLLDEMRLVKSKAERQLLKKAATISGKAHCAVMASCTSGKREQELYGTFLQSLLKEGGESEAFPTIVATGANACTLHYRGKESITESGQLLLLDGGAEYQLYAGDITRTFPVNGVFHGLQREIYAGLLELQKKLISLVSPGNTLENLHNECVLGIVDLLLGWKVLKGSQESILEQKSYLPYFPHRVGHWLGLDVHDVGGLEVGGNPKLFVEGMAITVEPGLYFHLKHTQHLSKEWQGLGLRIEDDIVVSKESQKGHEVLSASAPKEIKAIESLMQKS